MSTPACLTDFEALARDALPTSAWNYVAGGAGDELTLSANRRDLDALQLSPRILRDVSVIDTSSQLLGASLEFPLLLAPTAYHAMLHPGGECATARGAGSERVPLVVSSFATTSLEEVAAAATAPLWFQLYVQPDRGFTRELAQRAERAGCRALMITVDTPVLGTRNREQRDAFQLPAGLARVNLASLPASAVARHFDASGVYSEVLDATLTWRDIEWLRGITQLPVVLKGILSPADARLAVEHGADAIVVSNHGARNLDTLPSAIAALPRVAEAVGQRIPVLMDGGIRRGTDIVKALALGASAVMVGRPYLWALAARGEEGVASVCRILRTELRAAMALLGRASLGELDESVLWRQSS
ncbi:MAG: glycolate oxidase [Gemmatimonadetes bacterium]|nr:glycolate oxidase [Gemmatimonadota bacterium]